MLAKDAGFALTVLSVLALLLGEIRSLRAQEAGAAGPETRPAANALNPRISAIGNFLGISGPGRASTGMSLSELELGIQADVDPYSRADIFFVKPNGEDAEVEEAYVTFHSLPWGLQARGGKLKPAFGRLNRVHAHELPQADAPFVLQRFTGEEGFGSVGAEASGVFAPRGVFTELSYAFLQDLGGDREADPATTTVNDTGGNTVAVRVHRDEPAAPRKFRDFAHAAKLRAYKDLSEETNVEAGLSAALHQPRENTHKKMAALDVTLRWKPLREGQYRSWVWRAEALWRRSVFPRALDPVTGAQAAPAAKTDRRGLYSYFEAQAARRWRFGLRADYAEDPGTLGSRAATRGLTPYATFTLSEFNRFRFQWQRSWRAARAAESRVTLQWTIVLGPHGAHAF